MSTIHCPFVDDLIPIILEASDHWWTQDYLRLARISPSWLFYIRKRLYACPSICSFAAITALARTLQENPDLLTLVSGIELQPMNTVEGGNVLSAKDIDSVRFLLGLDELRRVKLGGQLARKAERFLNSLACPELVEELVIDGSLLEGAITSSASLEWDESILYKFPSLQRLKLVQLQLDIIPPSAPHHTPINHLVLDNVDIESGAFLCQLINGASVGLLSVWAKSASEYDEQVRLTLGNCDVQALQYQVRTSQRRADRSFLDIETTNSLSLRSLRMDGHAVDNGVLAEIVQRCSKLEELVIVGRSILVTSGEWESFIASRALPSLTRLGLPGGSHLPPFVKWSSDEIMAIQKASDLQRIQLVD